MNMAYPFSAATVAPPLNGLAMRPKLSAAIEFCDFEDRACSKRSRTACN